MNMKKCAIEVIYTNNYNFEETGRHQAWFFGNIYVSRHHLSRKQSKETSNHHWILKEILSTAIPKFKMQTRICTKCD